MRYLRLAAVLLMVPLAAAAQEHRSGDRGADGRRSDERQSNARPAPQSPANNRLPAWEQKQTPWWERQPLPSWEQPSPAQQMLPEWGRIKRSGPPDDVRQDGGDGRRRHSYQPAPIYVVPDYRFFPYTLPGTTQFYVAAPAPAAPVTAPTKVLGALRLEVEPRRLLQVYVDGRFAGTPDDYNDVLELTPGPRLIELRARGYRTLAFNADIVADRVITYRGALEDEAPVSRGEPLPEPPAPPATGSRTIFVIPGCYLGNVEPRASELRPGCDISKLTKVVP